MDYQRKMTWFLFAQLKWVFFSPTPKIFFWLVQPLKLEVTNFEVLSNEWDEYKGLDKHKHDESFVWESRVNHEWDKPQKDQNQWNMVAHSRARGRTTCSSPSRLPGILVFVAPPDCPLDQIWLPCGCTWYERLRWLGFSSESWLLHHCAPRWGHGWPSRSFWRTTGNLFLSSL